MRVHSTNPSLVTLRHGGREAVRLEEVPTNQRAPLATPRT